MKIIAFIERHQTEVIETILRHCGLWEEGWARGPPAAQVKAVGGRSRPEDQAGRPEQNQTGGWKVGLCLPEARIRPFRALSVSLQGEGSDRGGLRGPSRAEPSFPPGIDHDIPWPERRWGATLSAA
jgi:hypothetical protein